jgi:hypothetical protein
MLDSRKALCYSSQRRTQAVGEPPGPKMSLEQITPGGRIAEDQLDAYLERVKKKFSSDALAFVGPLLQGADEAIREALEFINREGKPCGIQKRPKLAVILETPGGYVDVAERIADLFHAHYEAVEFVVPNYAMSAGTILVMSGDEIWMDYYSLLGPIDPQVEGPKRNRIPARGYLLQYERLIKKSAQGKITTAELQFLIEKFDAAELYQYEQEMKLSVSLLKKWLVTYKFRNWHVTEERKLPVNKKMKRDRAEYIVKQLQDTNKWHSHARGISMEILQKDLKLKIKDFGAENCVTNCVREYYKLLIDYMEKLGTPNAVHVVKNFYPMRKLR